MTMSARDNPGVIAPPPLLFLGMLAIAWAVETWVRRLPTGLPRAVRLAVAALLLAAGAALIVGALRRFRAARTNPEPWKPSTAVVASGVYRHTRNPMYVGMTLVYLALALGLDGGVALLLVVPLLALVRWGVIAREERYMEAKFGDDYRRYRASVRRWL
ncbi:MAG: methyltransferase family protein [Gemmatirosa sp.]